MTENGSHVTWRELNLALDPLKLDLLEVSGDVKTLLRRQAEREGASAARRSWVESRRFAVTVGVAVLAALLSSVATLVWLAVG